MHGRIPFAACYDVHIMVQSACDRDYSGGVLRCVVCSDYLETFSFIFHSNFRYSVYFVVPLHPRNVALCSMGLYNISNVRYYLVITIIYDIEG